MHHVLLGSRKHRTKSRSQGKSERTGKDYQTLINDALAQHTGVGERPLTAAQVRKILREELAQIRPLLPIADIVDMVIMFMISKILMVMTVVDRVATPGLGGSALNECVEGFGSMAGI